jgi:hypothetical protein
MEANRGLLSPLLALVWVKMLVLSNESLLAHPLLPTETMKSTLRIAAVLGVVALAVALASSPLSAREMTGLGGSALRVVSGLTEPSALLMWGTVLAGLARAFGRRTSSN